MLNLKDERTCRGTLGIGLSNLELLSELFDKKYQAHLLAKRKDRKRALGGGKKGITPTAQDKVSFCLYYLKIYPTFDVLGERYGSSAGAVNRLLHKLLPVFYAAFKESGLQPISEFKNAAELTEYFAKKNIIEVFIDATEREHYRPKDKEAQSALFSGKQGYHTVKNTVICDEKKYIHFLGIATQGGMHDMALFHHEFPEREVSWFEDLTCYIDLGYLGFVKDYPKSNAKIPTKKPKNQLLTEEKKQNNRVISRRRILVEHAIGGLKRFHSLVNRYRNRRFDFEDLIIRVAAVIWNFQISMKI